MLVFGVLGTSFVVRTASLPLTLGSPPVPTHALRCCAVMGDDGICDVM